MDISHKAGWRYFFFLIFFAGASALGIRVIWMLLNGQVMDGDEEMSRGMAVFLSVMMALAFATYIETTLMLLWQLLRHNGCVLELTPHGVENTLVFVNLLAFLFVFPVRRIPWEAVTYADFDDNPYIRVNTKLVDAGIFAKLLLWIMGYQFGLSFVKPAVSAEEVKRYAHRFSIETE